MKAIKFLFKFILWAALLVVALVLTLPLWIGPVAKITANAIVPKVTGTAFNLGAFALNPYSGKLVVGNVLLGNPAGFDQKMAVTLGDFAVSVDAATAANDTVVVRDIVLKDVFVSYVSNAKGENNFSIIAKNAKGEDEPKAKGEGEKKVKARGDGEQGNGKPSTSQTPQTSQTSETSKKVIIDHLLISNVLVQFGPIAMPMPNVELTGIGRKSNGVTFAEAWDQIHAQVMSSFNSVGDLAKQLNALGVDLGKLGLEQTGKTMRAVKDVDVKVITETVKKVDVKGVTEAAKKADVKGVTDAVKGSTKIMGEGAGKTVDAVGDSAGKAVDAIKNLF